MTKLINCDIDNTLDYGDTIVMFGDKLHETINGPNISSIQICDISKYIRNMISEISIAFSVPCSVVDDDISSILDWNASFTN